MTQLFVNMTDETKQLMAAADSAYSAFLDSRVAYATEHESFYTWLESHLGPEYHMAYMMIKKQALEGTSSAGFLFMAGGRGFAPRSAVLETAALLTELLSYKAAIGGSLYIPRTCSTLKRDVGRCRVGGTLSCPRTHQCAEGAPNEQKRNNPACRAHV